jgi:hypothetical protein
MTERRTLSRLLTFLYALSFALFLGTIGELFAVKHYGDGERIRVLPFGLCIAGGLAVIAVWWRPSRTTFAVVRATMMVIALGSLLGLYEHLNGNYGFVREVRPNASLRTKIIETLTGHAPLMAPGVLAVAAIVAIAGTYAGAALARDWVTESRAGTANRLEPQSLHRREL